ncbi:MAG TPA: RES family NAD+ phosphorylase [Planctomycetaceae bacterium]|nr:RES family NAD+ phosphorylase [Planctomycetaceae bacterium]
MITETLIDGHEWLRIGERDWVDPLDPTFAQQRGGRWNPPGSWRTLYLNEDLVTARLNLRAFIADWPYEPEDLRSETGPHLAVATLPRRQQVADVHSPDGVVGVGLPASYPLDDTGRLVGEEECQPIGERIKDAGLRGVRCRSAQVRDGAGRELAWFPATVRSRATLANRLEFDRWYWT